VTHRRHLHAADRRVVSMDDGVLDLDAVDENHLAGPDSLRQDTPAEAARAEKH
jgi:hypothetical protein